MNKQIMYESDESAKFVTGISGWVDRNGHFWGDNEHLARWSGCTHKVCECGEIITKHYTCCNTCQDKKRIERFSALEKKEWDGVTPLSLDSGDEYFFSEDELRDFMEEHDLVIDQIQLRLCKPLKMPQVDESYFLDEMHEDAELPDTVYAALLKLNEAVRACEPQSWEPDKYAAIVKL